MTAPHEIPRHGCAVIHVTSSAIGHHELLRCRLTRTGAWPLPPYAGWKMQSSSLQEKERSLRSLLEIRTYVAREGSSTTTGWVAPFPDGFSPFDVA